jgi:MFS family permease
MVADLLPEKQRTQGFGVIRVAHNLAWVVGPTIGGFLTTRSYLSLFILDAILSSITAAIVYKMIPETKPEQSQEQVSIFKAFVGYRLVARDTLFMAFIATSMLMLVGYEQIYSTLSVFLRDIHGIPTQKYGVLMSFNAAIVVIFQFWVTRQTTKHAPMLTMAYGTGFILIGLFMYGVVSTYPLFVLTMLLITIGEMVVDPVGQALVARLAPENMRGRYMAFYGWGWTLPATVGPWAAGLIMDNINPNWVWYAAGTLCAVSVAGFCMLHLKKRESLTSEPAPRLVASNT